MSMVWWMNKWTSSSSPLVECIAANTPDMSKSDDRNKCWIAQNKKCRRADVDFLIGFQNNERLKDGFLIERSTVGRTESVGCRIATLCSSSVVNYSIPVA